MPHQSTRKRDRRAQVGPMRDRIRISDREIIEPDFGSADFLEQFKARAIERWSTVRTTAGRTLFAGVGVDVAITHEIIIRYDEGVSSESWIILQDETRLDVVQVEDLDERNEWMVLLCTDRGDKSFEASQA